MTTELVRHYCDIIIIAARTVDKGVVDFKENESLDRWKLLDRVFVEYVITWLLVTAGGYYISYVSSET